MSFGKNFLPGPTGVHPEVLEAMTQPLFAHYSQRMRDKIAAIQPMLRQMLGTEEPVFVVTCSGTGLMEAAIRNAVRHRVLVVVNGFFGEYWARIAEACGKQVIRASVPLGKTLEAEQLEAFLDGPQLDAVAVVHSESSTGALTPLAALAEVVRTKPDLLFLVDAVSSAGGIPIEMDRIGLDLVVTASQKAIAIPPGIAFGAASPRLVERAATLGDAGYYFGIPRLLRMAREAAVFETPAISTYFALFHQLGRITAAGGWEPRWARHRALAARVAEWVGRHPQLSFLAPEGRRSLTVSALQLRDGKDPVALQQALETEGFYIGTRLDPTHGPVFRIGHMGDVLVDHLDGLFAALEPLI